MLGKILVCQTTSLVDGRNVLFDPYLVFPVPFLPTMASFSVFGMYDYSNERKREYLSKIEIVDSRGKTIFSTEGTLNVAVPIDMDTGVINFGIEVNSLILTVDGKYKCVFYVDDNVVDTCEFMVFNKNITLD